MSITLEIAKDRELWDNLVEKSPHGTIFHTWKFLKIVEKHTPSKLYPLIGMRGTTPVGIYPLFSQKRFFLKMVFSPPPHCAVLYLGPAIVGYDNLKQSKRESVFIEFQREVDNFISSELKPDYTLISTPPNLLDCRPLKWCGYNIRPSYSYVINLTNGTENVWKQLKKHLRQSINKTKREGVSIEEGSKEELEAIYNLLNERYKEQEEIVTVPKRYLFDLYDFFHPKNLKIFVAKYKGEIRTGIIDIWYKDKVATWIGSTKTYLKGISPNDLLFWETIRKGCEHGFKQYEIIGAAGVRRLHSYYSKCNPELLLWFSARKYSSFVPKLLEASYIKILKPAYEKIKSIKSKR